MNPSVYPIEYTSFKYDNFTFLSSSPMDSVRGQLFYDWCYKTFPECRMTRIPVNVGACAVDVQSFLRWHGRTSASPRALLHQLHMLVTTRMPNATHESSLHLGVMNTSFEKDRTETTDGAVEAHLYVKDWKFSRANTIATYFIDNPEHLDQWPFPDPDLRMIHFDWTVFAWQWRLLITREAGSLFTGYSIYNALHESASIDTIHTHRRRFPPLPSREREIHAAIDVDGQSHNIVILNNVPPPPSSPDKNNNTNNNNNNTNDPFIAQWNESNRNTIQLKWRGTLSAIRTLFLSKSSSLFLHTHASDGLWLAVVCALHAYEEGVTLEQWSCQWRDQPLLDIAHIARSMVKRFRDTKAALAACLLFWVNTECTDPDTYTNVFERLSRGNLRPSKGADFALSLNCFIRRDRDHTIESTTHVLKTCNALCRAIWQRARSLTHAQYRPEHVVYPRVFWEAWGVVNVPDFTMTISECIEWLNFAYSCLVKTDFNIHLLTSSSSSSSTSTTTTTNQPAKKDALFYGLASHVNGLQSPPVIKKI
jgi:hypothetical protein